jgi:hypothetical protein
LKPAGLLVLVDDMPEPGASATDLEVFKRGWECPVLWGGADWRSAFAGEQLSLVLERDLTPDCRPRPLPGIARLEWLNRAATRLIPSAGLRQVLASHRGGLALERLLRQGGMRYRMLVARKTSG